MPITEELEGILMQDVDDKGFAQMGMDIKGDIVRLMEQNGVDINTPWEGAPLVVTLAETYTNYPTISFLLDQDKDKKKSAGTRNALLSILVASIGTLGTGGKELILKLLDQGADPNIVDARGLTLLHVALGRGVFTSADIVAKLIEKGAKVNSVTLKKQIPTLVYAVMHEVSPDVIKVLVENGVDLGAKYNGETAKDIVTKSPELKELYKGVLSMMTPGLRDVQSLMATPGLIKKLPFGVEATVGELLTGKKGTLEQQAAELKAGRRRKRTYRKKQQKRRKTRK